MRLFSIGEKVVSREKLLDAVDAILADESAGATQEEAARHAGVQRSVRLLPRDPRRGAPRATRVALVGFPVANVREVRALAEGTPSISCSWSSQAERESIEAGHPTNVFNQLLETLAALRDFDTLVLIASDWRIETIERILGAEVVGIPLGHSPIREDKSWTIDELDGSCRRSCRRRWTGTRGRNRAARPCVVAAAGARREVDAIKEVVQCQHRLVEARSRVEVELFGEPFRISREGTDGDMDAAGRALRRARRHGRRLRAWRHRPVPARGRPRLPLPRRQAVPAPPCSRRRSSTGPGSRAPSRATSYVTWREDLGLDLAGKRVLVTSAVDRWGMSRRFADAGCEMTYGDLLYALGVPIMIHDARHARARRSTSSRRSPCSCPFSWLYEAEADHEPPRSKTDSRSTPSSTRTPTSSRATTSTCARYMPDDMSGKWVVTNTTTAEDVEFLRARAASSCWSRALRGWKGAVSAPTSSRRRWSRSTARRRRCLPRATSSCCTAPASLPISCGFRGADRSALASGIVSAIVTRVSTLTRYAGLLALVLATLVVVMVCGEVLCESCSHSFMSRVDRADRFRRTVAKILAQLTSAVSAGWSGIVALLRARHAAATDLASSNPGCGGDPADLTSRRSSRPSVRRTIRQESPMVRVTRFSALIAALALSLATAVPAFAAASSLQTVDVITHDEGSQSVMLDLGHAARGCDPAGGDLPVCTSGCAAPVGR